MKALEGEVTQEVYDKSQVRTKLVDDRSIATLITLSSRHMAARKQNLVL